MSGSTPLAAARWYVRHGYAPVPIPHKRKYPRLLNWQKLIISEPELPHYFNGAAINIGILLGAPSGGRVDADLDCREARFLAPRFLPATRARFGRAGAPLSHWIYTVIGELRRKTFRDPRLPDNDERGMVLELRGTGHQTMFPPSTHPSGEQVTWADGDKVPAEIELAVLLSQAGQLAAAALLARAWPRTGSRQDAALALGGGLLRAGWTEEQAAAFVLAVAEAAGDEEGEKRAETVRCSAKANKADRQTTGWPTLAKLIDSKVVDAVREWLGMRSRPATASEDPTPSIPNAPPVPEWPTLDAAALYGLVGDVVRAIDPHTEGDPVAVLTNYLVMVGNAIGGGPYSPVGATWHRVNLFAAHVGGTSKNRKGTAYSDTRAIVESADPTWAAKRISGGLSSGEGLIYPIRDPVEKIKKGETVIEDPGEPDKRLLIVEEEFSAVCKVATREGNTITEQIRKAWDGRTLGVMTRNSPLRATSPHVSILAHITQEELLRVFDSTDAANGFGNRFLWVCVRRSKLLPEGGRLPDGEAASLIHRTAQAIAFARKQGEVRRNNDARSLWAELYPELSEGRPGMLGALIARAEAHVLRLSLLYALLDQSPSITPDHLLAALALWDYCEASARFIFGDQTGDPIADRILAALRASGPMAQNDIIDLLGRHVNAGRLGKALEVLTHAGLVASEREETGGRPRTVWSAR